MGKLEERIKCMETDAAALTKRNQEAIGDKNKKLAELTSELSNVKSSLTAKESMCISSEQKFEQIKATLTDKEKEIQNLSKIISELKQSNVAISEKEREITQLKSKMEEMTLRQKSATEEKNKLESENKMLNEKVSKTMEMEKVIQSTKESM